MDDPDATSATHILNALERMHVKCRNEYKSTDCEGGDFSSKNQQNKSKANPIDAIRKSTSGYAVAALPKLIPSKGPAAIRIRRWAGRDKFLRKNDVVAIGHASLQPQTVQTSLQSRANRKSVCGSMNDKRPGRKHGAKAISGAKKNSKTIRKEIDLNNNSFTRKDFAPDVRRPKMKKCSLDLNIEVSLHQKQSADIELPPVIASSTDSLDEATISDCLSPAQSSNFFTPGVSRQSNQLNLSNVCRVLSDECYSKLTDQPGEEEPVTRKNAQRAIARYYEQKQKLNCHSKIIVIHLPNQSSIVEHGAADLFGNKPKLLMRNGLRTNPVPMTLHFLDEVQLDNSA